MNRNIQESPVLSQLKHVVPFHARTMFGCVDVYAGDVFFAIVDGEQLYFKVDQLHVFRPNRDVRFSQDKSPYKTQIGAASKRPGGRMCYIQLGAEGLLAASGYHMLASDQLERFRTAIDHPRHGAEIEQIIDSLQYDDHKVGWGVAAPLKTAPRGYPKDHPRVELLRWKGVMLRAEWGTPPWLHMPHAVAHVEALWRAAAPLNDWLDAHVGPTQLPPDDKRWAR